MEQQFEDILRIRDAIERWVVYRDAREWDKFAELWDPEGIMATTGGEVPFRQFIQTVRKRTAEGLNVLHNLSGTAVEVRGDHAVAMTKFVFVQRAPIDGVLCDVTCYERHYDLWRKTDGKWGLYYRATIADKDRIDPVDPDAKLVFDPAILNQYPVEYRYLAYLKEKAGHPVSKDCPRLSGGSATEELFKKGEDWLKE